MYCRMIRGGYLRANGEMACYCGPGEEVTLAQVPTDHTNFNFIEDIYKNGPHQNVRDNMQRSVLPYPSICLKCFYLDPFGQHQMEKFSSEIEWMHMEATSMCNLRCSFCIPMDERPKFRKKPHYIPRAMYEKIIDDIVAAGMNLKWSYFSGRGEPGLHRDLWTMVKYAKDRLDTNFLVNTNGNINFNELIVESGLDKIKIAIDGVDQEKYASYRRGGKIQRLFDLTSSIVEHRNKLGVKNPWIIWQYVVFSHNDSEDELRRIQEIATDLGVDQLLFVNTYTANYSNVDFDSIPRIHPNVEFKDVKSTVSLSVKARTAA